ncbi:hypothetical protein COY25_01485 [Candidatus Uhrbacteria bacterium CG_4_10_14_0_2_um_filter_41_7]|uniref:Uncharacterized protein n=1 Tax=Candidatus Uhrbacteria bacterium CG_4_9_14_3_um_filter_41_35 TaxID=1975034 RepID=A0A2M7XEM6_9BACT|nr:MAG: hypothetical protein COV92_00710 [Candidatus Uhrbacteria bacterium CG11_big_fil_rev_8_21_14_0_20_41_9]PIZ54957.1 MAG: hypothetical protein COY25_01485 [Candidatus Uhrbacteria bacterium CG_4_10_14_0_2_um_filter_41_7]PJA46324.1 MAG: hypothetical protein CO173_03115 [Candidatus Uhrbacteria bacterium CG_4_9_14_3_um_filter_41_35]
MKLVRETNKTKERLVYVFVTILVIMVLIVWGFQLQKMFRESAEFAEKDHYSQIQQGMDLAKSLEDSIPGQKKSFSEIIEHTKLTMQEQMIKERAKSMVAGQMIDQLNQEIPETLQTEENLEQTEASSTPAIIEKNAP